MCGFSIHRNMTENYVPFIMAVVAYVYAAGINASKSIPPPNPDHTGVVAIMAIYAGSRYVGC